MVVQCNLWHALPGKVDTLIRFYTFFIGFLRTGVALLFISFHLGLALFLELGLFPYMYVADWILLLPAWFWRKTGDRVSEKLRLAVSSRNQLFKSILE